MPLPWASLSCNGVVGIVVAVVAVVAAGGVECRWQSLATATLAGWLLVVPFMVDDVDSGAATVGGGGCGSGGHVGAGEFVGLFACLGWSFCVHG